MIATSFDIDRIMAVMATAFPPDFGEAWNRRQLVDALVVGNCHYAIAGSDACAPDAPAAGRDPAVGRDPAADHHAATGADIDTAGFRLSRSGFDEEELLLFAVAPAYRRRGVGMAMLRSLADDARARGANRLLLEMRRGNPAEGLYRTFGFIPIGERRHYYRLRDGSRVDAITFACAL